MWTDATALAAGEAGALALARAKAALLGGELVKPSPRVAEDFPERQFRPVYK